MAEDKSRNGSTPVHIIGTLVCFLLCGAACAQSGTVVLDETACWRQYYRFDLNRYDAAILKSQGQKIVGRRGLQRQKRSVERLLRKRGIDPGTVDWRDYACVAMGGGARAFVPVPTPAPPAAWM